MYLCPSAVLYYIFVEPGFQDKKVIILEVMWLELEVVVDHSLCECTVVYVTCEWIIFFTIGVVWTLNSIGSCSRETTWHDSKVSQEEPGTLNVSG